MTMFSFLKLLGTYFSDVKEHFRGVMRFRIHGKLLYIVGCPLSTFYWYVFMNLTQSL